MNQGSSDLVEECFIALNYLFILIHRFLKISSSCSKITTLRRHSAISRPVKCALTWAVAKNNLKIISFPIMTFTSSLHFLNIPPPSPENKRLGRKSQISTNTRPSSLRTASFNTLRVENPFDCFSIAAGIWSDVSLNKKSSGL